MKPMLRIALGAILISSSFSLADTVDIWTPDTPASAVEGGASGTQRLFGAADCGGWTLSPDARADAEKQAEKNALAACQGTAVERTSDWSYQQACLHNVYVRWDLSANFRCAARQDHARVGGQAAATIAANAGAAAQIACVSTFEPVMSNGVLHSYKDLYQCTVRDGAGHEKTITDEQTDDGLAWAKQEGAVALFEALPVYLQSRVGDWLYRKLATVQCAQGACDLQGAILPGTQSR